MCGERFIDWVFLPAIGRSGSILIAWDVRSVTIIEIMVDMFSVSVKFKPKEGEC